jgi:hypothetical protein
MADLRAIIKRNRQIVEALDHDLQRRPAAARHSHTNEAIAHYG